MTDKTIESILIIGNGFDLHCGLASSFSEYFVETCLNKVSTFYQLFKREDYEEADKLFLDNTDVINFWSFLFYVHYYSDSPYRIGKTKGKNWFDIEQLICDALTTDILNGFKLENYIKEAFKALESGASVRRIANARVRENPYIFYPFFEKTPLTNVYDYLLTELYKFEKSFKGYLICRVDEKYRDECYSFLGKLLKDEDFVDLINFNYTTIEANGYINRQTNVHGDLYGDEIIIGIDSNSAISDDLISFSKTYRNMHRIKEPFELPKSVKRLLFYGHSLSDADFSYFHSLFDMFKLYDGNLELKFFYSDYKNSTIENEINHAKTVKQIYKLINEYSEKTHDDKNLLHRLLLEGRITIEKI